MQPVPPSASRRLAANSPLVTVRRSQYVRRGADKSLAFLIFSFAAQPQEFFLDGLKKLEQRSQKCVELGGEYVE
jgi:hypothetical protein